MNIVEKAQMFQDSWSQKRIQNKTDKEQRYREWLKEPGRTLPSYKVLSRWRRNIALATLLSFIPVTLQMFFFYDTMWDETYDTRGWIMFIVGIVFVCLSAFTAMIDFTIYRRWQNQTPYTSWINWSADSSKTKNKTD